MNAAKTNFKVIGLVIGVILLIAVGAFLVLRVARPDPGFRLTHEDLRSDSGIWLMTSYWRITNTNDEPLVIKRVVYNSEFNAEPVWEPKTPQERSEQNKAFLRAMERMVTGESAPPRPTLTFPVRLTVGESIKVLEWNRGRGGYAKEVIYIDVYTDRGTFRFNPSEGKFD